MDTTERKSVHVVQAHIQAQAHDDAWTLQFLFLALATFPQLPPNKLFGAEGMSAYMMEYRQHFCTSISCACFKEELA